MPKVTPKNPRAHATRKKILDAAQRVFCYYGYNGATYELIAKEAKVSKALVVKHHGTIEEIVTVCLEDFMASFIEYLKDSGVQNGTSYIQHIDRIFQHFKKNRDMWKFVLTIWLTPALARFSDVVFPSYLQVLTDTTKMFPNEIDPSEAKELSYSMGSALMSYTIGGNEENFLKARSAVLNKFLK